MEKINDDLQAYLGIIKMSHLIDIFVKNKILLKDLLGFKSEDFDKVKTFLLDFNSF